MESKKGLLFYANEHLTCRNYQHENVAAFVYRELMPGQPVLQDTAKHHLLLLIKGSCVISCDRFVGRQFSAGEMVFIPMASSCISHVTRQMEFIDLRFENITSGCDKMALQRYFSFCKDLEYDFRGIPIRKPLDMFCQLLSVCLQSGLNCVHFHEMKHKELFLYLRAYYSNEEIAELFYPIASRSFDFKTFVFQNWRKTKTLEELIGLSTMGRSSFLRKFKSEFGMSAHQWKLQQLKAQVINELSVPGTSLKEVAANLGFESPSNFNHFCQRNFGSSPSEVARRIWMKPETALGNGEV